MKARLVKCKSQAYDHNVEQSRRQARTWTGHRAERRERDRESFNPPRIKVTKKDLVRFDNQLSKALANYQASLNNPEAYTAKQIRRLKRKALACVAKVKDAIRARNQRTPDREVIQFFYVDASRDRKKDCKLPKRVGYGLRTPAKNDNPKRGRAVLPLVNPAYVVSRKTSTDKLQKHRRDSHLNRGYFGEDKWKRNGKE